MEIHRCRFVAHDPSAINQIAVTPAAYPNPLVAVCRVNGDLELWHTTLQPTPVSLPVRIQPAAAEWRYAPSCHCIGVISGCQGASIEAIAFALATDSDIDSDDETTGRAALASTLTPRLFSASLDGSLIEYDVNNLNVLVRSDAYGGGAIWSLAVSPCQRFLAVGCEDGCIRLFDIAGQPGTLEFIRAFDKQKGRIVSLAWSAASADQAVLFSGSADGMIRKWDVNKGRAVQRMNVGTSAVAKSGDDVLVWSLVVLSDGTVVSGDSLGSVKFWDGQTCTLVQSFQSHTADILTLAVNQDGDTIFASGIDHKIVMFRLSVPEGASVHSVPKWITSKHRRFHTHDVRSMVWLEQRQVNSNQAPLKRKLNNKHRAPAAPTSGMSILISGGVDTFLTIFPNPVERFLNSSIQPVRLTPFQRSPVGQMSSEKRLLVSFSQDCVSLWSLGKSQDASKNDDARYMPLPIQEGPRFVMELKMQNGLHVVAATLSPNGRWLAVIDARSALRLYDICDDYRLTNQTRRLNDFSGCRKILFSQDSQSLMVALANGSVVALQLDADQDASFAQIEVAESVSLVSLIVSFDVSPCRRFVAIGDSMNYIRVVDTATHKTQSLPQLTSGLHTTVKFVSVDDRVLLFIAVSNNSRQSTQLLAYDPETASIVSLNDAVVEWMKTRKEKILGIDAVSLPAVPDGQTESALFLWTYKWIGRVPLKALLSADATEKASFTDRYENVLYFGVLDGQERSEAVVVERPWMSVVENMQPAVIDKKYGN